MKSLAWGILATGGIARKFAESLPKSSTGELVAVGSRTKEAAHRFGEEFGVARQHGSYQDLVDDPAVQAVYISAPNHLHKEWTIKCAEAGKHILCEKPFTVNKQEAEQALDVVRDKGVFFMEAFMYRCHPQTARLRRLVQDGAIGEVRLIQSTFCFNMGPKYDNIRLSNPAAGGAIMDVGCYTASMARLIAADEPVEVRGAAQIGPVSQVDEQSVASLKFPNGIVANLACATQVSADSELRVWGSNGSIRVPNPWFPGETANRILLKTGSEEKEVMVDGGAELYAIEADTVARHLEEKEAPAPCMTWNDTLGNMALLDAWRHSIGLVFEVEK